MFSTPAIRVPAKEKGLAIRGVEMRGRIGEKRKENVPSIMNIKKEKRPPRLMWFAMYHTSVYEIIGKVPMHVCTLRSGWKYSKNVDWLALPLFLNKCLNFSAIFGMRLIFSYRGSSIYICICALVKREEMCCPLVTDGDGNPPWNAKWYHYHC